MNIFYAIVENTGREDSESVNAGAVKFLNLVTIYVAVSIKKKFSFSKNLRIFNKPSVTNEVERFLDKPIVVCWESASLLHSGIR